MTVAYMQFTHTSAKIGVFFRVLRIWQGGIFKVRTLNAGTVHVFTVTGDFGGLFCLSCKEE